jgi:hypothetical protein
MKEIVKKFDDLYNKLSSSRFLRKDGLGGEIPFFISPYKAAHELEITESIELLKKKLDTAGVPVLDINLYDLVCNLLEREIGLDEFFEIEKAIPIIKIIKTIFLYFLLIMFILIFS